jgi:hypothetical protein
MDAADCHSYPGPNRLTPEEFGRWIDAFISFQDTADENGKKDEDDPRWWAVFWFMCGNSDAAAPEDCWKGILEVLARRPSDKVLAVLAAGPLEDLIHRFGSQFIDRIEQQARAHSAFRDLLRGVWESGTRDVWQRVQRAQEGPTGFED